MKKETGSEGPSSELDEWVQAALLNHAGDRFEAGFKLGVMSGDAGARRYFRVLPVETPAHSRQEPTCDGLLVMQSPADQSFLSFLQINKLLHQQKLRAPRVFAQDATKGFMLLEDFGDSLLKNELDTDSGSTIFKNDILPILTSMTDCSTSALPNYNQDKLNQEMQLFEDWFCNKHISRPLDREEQQCWVDLKHQLSSSAMQQPRGFVHRDFHCCNVMRCKDSTIGIIDFQDAVAGPISYDLASWIWDRYISWPRTEIENWMLLARESLSPRTEPKDWIRSCDLMGLQRNLKIVGIFCRLHYRDGKSGYLDLLPRFCQYIIDVLDLYPELDALASPSRQRLTAFLQSI